MRITQRMMTQNAIQHMNENLERLQSLQKKIASGKAFQYASENPSGAVASLSLRSNLDTIHSYLGSIQSADDWMSANENALQGMVDVATRAKDLTLSGTSDTFGASERQSLAGELDVLLQHAVDIGNTEHRDTTIFAGFKITTPPFSLVDTTGDGQYDSVNFNGDNGTILRQIGPGQTIAQNIDGQAAFSPLFAAIITARDALNANDVAAIQTAVTSLQTALDNLDDAVVLNGGRQRQLRKAGERIERTEIELKSLLSLKEDVNMADAISNLRLQETVYQTVLEVGNRAISALSLFDMLS